MATFSSVLAAIERQGDFATLKYDGIRGTLFDNRCYPDAYALVAVIEAQIEAVKTELKNAQEVLDIGTTGLHPRQRLWLMRQKKNAKNNVKHLPRYLERFENLLKEVKADLQEEQQHPKHHEGEIPACFAEHEEIMTHEKVHAAFQRMLPTSVLTSASQVRARTAVIVKATQTFMNDLGPKSRDLFLLALPELPTVYNIEEVIAGVGGLAKTRQHEIEGKKIAAEKRAMLGAFYSYLARGISDMPAPERRKFSKKFIELAWGSTLEWHKKYGDNFMAAMQALATIVRSTKRDMEAQWSRPRNPYELATKRTK